MSAPGLVVVGASLAGLRAVEAARRSDFHGTVTLVGAEPHLPYDRPPLSKEFLTTAAAPKFFRTEASLRDDLDVGLRLGAPVTALHTEERAVVAAFSFLVPDWPPPQGALWQAGSWSSSVSRSAPAKAYDDARQRRTRTWLTAD